MSFIKDLDFKVNYAWFDGSEAFKCDMNNKLLHIHIEKKRKQTSLRIYADKPLKPEEQGDMINKILKEFGIYPPIEVKKEDNGIETFYINNIPLWIAPLNPSVAMVKEVKALIAEYLTSKWNIKL